MFTVNKNPTTQDLRKFGVAMMLGFGMLGAILWYLHARTGGAGPATWGAGGAKIASTLMWTAGAVCFVVSRVRPAMARPIYVIWMRVTVPIGLLMSTVLLTLLFVLILPVFALIVRLSDPLRKKLSSGGTYWEDYKPHEPTIERMRRPF